MRADRTMGNRESQADTPRARRLLRLVETRQAGHGDDDADRLADRLFGHNQLVLYRGLSWRLCPDGSLRRWDVVAQRWESIWKDGWAKDEATIIDDGREAAASTLSVPEPAQPEDVSAVEGCTCLGGTLRALCVYGKYTVVFGRESIKILSLQAGTIEIPREEIVEVEVGGRGPVGRGAMSMEGLAFDSVDATEDDLAATAVVRSLVARARMDTSIRIATRSGEAIFHCDCATPEELRRSLAPFRKELELSSPDGAQARVDVAGRLVELADLKTRGLLTDEEFAAAKASVLGTKP